MMIQGIKDVLEKTPPELVGDISDNGVTLTGGTSLLWGMDKLVENETGIETKLPRTPCTQQLTAPLRQSMILNI